MLDFFLKGILCFLSLQDVVLLITAKWCGFCSSFSHTYLQLAKYFSSARDLVFAR